MSNELKPEVGDIVKVERSYWGDSVYFTEHKLEELNFCLGFYGDSEGFGPRSPCNFTPLCELYDKSPEAKDEYWSNYGPYFSEYINKFEIIKQLDKQA